jgi:hypothetical protein
VQLPVVGTSVGSTFHSTLTGTGAYPKIIRHPKVIQASRAFPADPEGTQPSVGNSVKIS